MACKEPSSRKQSSFEPPEKEKKQCEEQPKITRETLLEALEEVENEIKKLGEETLRERLEKLYSQVKGVLENQGKEIKRLRDQVRKLEEEVESQKAKNKRLERALSVAQATWVWEKHLARFVVADKKIYEYGCFTQMEDYLAKQDVPQNLFTIIQDKLTIWTEEHWEVVRSVRIERNGMAHPDLIDLDLVESELKKIYPKYRESLEDMLEELKMTASLMKFGRLVDFYKRNNLFPTNDAWSKTEDALSNITSWNREFEDIGGLQNIEHEEAKTYLAKYVDDGSMEDKYFSIVDLVKDGNRRRLGKLAWKIEGSGIVDRLSMEHGEALNQLKKLLPNPRDESVVKGLGKEEAKLHVPDFLPKDFWKYGTEIVEKYFKKLQH